MLISNVLFELRSQCQYIVVAIDELNNIGPVTSHSYSQLVWIIDTKRTLREDDLFVMTEFYRIIGQLTDNVKLCDHKYLSK